MISPTGKGCNAECNDHGTCSSGVCQCDTAWRGSLCEVRGCPGVQHDCSQHGVCNSATQECTCDPGEMKLQILDQFKAIVVYGLTVFLVSLVCLSIICLSAFRLLIPQYEIRGQLVFSLSVCDCMAHDFNNRGVLAF